MTDNNADDTNGQRTNLSRRGAVALLGTAAVGGTAATGAFSKLTADRPIDVQVVSSGADSELGADNTTSTLEITNNVNENINATIRTTDSELLLTTVNGSTSASANRSDPYEITDIDAGSTAKVEFVHNTTSTSTPVEFEVEAFSQTDGLSIASAQAVDVAGSIEPAFYLLDGRDITNVSDGTDISSSDWSPKLGSASISPSGAAYNSTGVNSVPGVDFQSSNYDYLRTSDFGDFGSTRDSSAVGYLFSTTSTGVLGGGQFQNSNAEYTLYTGAGYGSTDTYPSHVMGDSIGTNYSVEIPTDVTDGNNYLVGFDINGTNKSDVTGYLNGRQKSVQTNGSDLGSTFPNFGNAFPLSARDADGSIKSVTDNTISGFILADGPLGADGWEAVAKYFDMY